MRLWNLTLVLILVTGVLVGCGGEADEPEGDVASVDSNPNPDSALDASYEGAPPVSSQLALGIFELEETENAVTVEQAGQSQCRRIASTGFLTGGGEVPLGARRTSAGTAAQTRRSLQPRSRGGQHLAHGPLALRKAQCREETAGTRPLPSVHA